MKFKILRTLRRPWFWVLGLLVVLAFVGSGWVRAREGQEALHKARMHPTFVLLDEDGQPVVKTGKPISTMKTCGACHDVGFITTHSYHATLGWESQNAVGQVPGGHPWDLSPGPFGRWNPLVYAHLNPDAGPMMDIGTPNWVQTFTRHVGGGPATLSREGKPLNLLPPDPKHPDTAYRDPKTNQIRAWDWRASGVVEMNCFLCHWPQPNNQARLEALQAGRFAWAATATLEGRGLVTREGERWVYNAAAFDEEGAVLPAFLQIQAPTDENCGLCHGLTHTSKAPLIAPVGDWTAAWETATTGQVFAGEKINESGMNIADKDALSRPWDVHLERLIQCTDCHYALNNPIYLQKEDKPEYVLFDPRRPDFSEYLYRPSHDFARGKSAQHAVAPELRGTMRRCEQCHSVEATHNWLPYKYRHMEQLSCETCHIPRLYAPAIKEVDWTVPQEGLHPRIAVRGLEGPDTVNGLVTGYEPVLLPRRDITGRTRLAPYNLITAWYWVYGEPPQPVPKWALRQVFFTEDGRYQERLVQLLDANGDGQLSSEELRLRTQDQETTIARWLQEAGFPKARIMGEVQAYSVNHDVAVPEFALKDCRACHAEHSRLVRPFPLASIGPAGHRPELWLGTDVTFTGQVHNQGDALIYQPKVAHLYVFGRTRVSWVEWIGLLAVVGTVLGVSVHAGMRVVAARRQIRTVTQGQLRQMYLYSLYERLWHWLQAVAILLLLLTGYLIHNPKWLSWIPYRGLVYAHNVFAVVLLFDAALAFFYHLASGEIRQFLPPTRGFFYQAYQQARYYLYGIFRGEPHPFHKTRERKLNSLQQATYFVLLNVMLPVQMLTGILMWLGWYWPDLLDRVGGLKTLAPIHTLFAWFFAAFIVIHIYLTTTGPTPTTYLKAMITGWEDVEEPIKHEHPPASSENKEASHDGP